MLNSIITLYYANASWEWYLGSWVSVNVYRPTERPVSMAAFATLIRRRCGRAADFPLPHLYSGHSHASI